MKRERLFSIGLGLALGAGTVWALDRYGSGATNLFPRKENPSGALEPDEIVPEDGRRSRIPSQVEDVMRGVIRAGGRVWMEKAGDTWGYVFDEIQGKGKKAAPSGPVIEIDPSTVRQVKVKK